jgi:hypothetical protein
MSFGQCRVSPHRTGALLPNSRRGVIVAIGVMDVCDGAHWAFVVNRNEQWAATRGYGVTSNTTPFPYGAPNSPPYSVVP